MQLIVLGRDSYPDRNGGTPQRPRTMAGKDPKETARNRIVAAARKRFAHSGYAKTGMADLAADCAMSPANLYRFFPGKLDIAEAIAMAAFESHIARLRRDAARPGRTGRQTLRDLMLGELRRTYLRLEKDPRAFELVEAVAAGRPAFAAWMLARERAIIAEILAGAERRGELRIADRDFAAELILSATMKFRHPPLWSQLALPRLERELDGVLGLLLDGLAAQPQVLSPEIA